MIMFTIKSELDKWLSEHPPRPPPPPAPPTPAHTQINWEITAKIWTLGENGFNFLE